MRSSHIFFLALVVGVHASEPSAVAANRNRESQDVGVVQLAHNLLTRAAKTSSRDIVAVDDTTLGKPSQLAISPTSIKAPVLRAGAIAPRTSKPQFLGKGAAGQFAFNKDIVTDLQVYPHESCPRGSVLAKASENAEYDKMVDENRMITVQESQIRYAGALAVFIGAVKSYVDMQAAGVYDYNQIAAGTAGAFLLFESARRSF
eukprot:gnl/TRDRNA2_/TRDRNA2_37169_c0_seq1.p2 gnl/TRDRNA2_/TRDRNA2_37169_c0~~gnl/TRDRNA2_/TRDRNA2_37169_c0_seq1.p2  ORF type:complete len:203 (+),score=29.79 gnl/TRDRNA2_/TRDRNA2_37169_c0_seq1:143-751(+)